MKNFNFLRKKELDISNLSFAQKGLEFYMKVKEDHPNLSNIWEKFDTDDGRYVIEILTNNNGKIIFFPTNGTTKKMVVILNVERDGIIDIDVE